VDFLGDLARELFERRHDAAPVPFRDCSGPDFEPTRQDCHGNVDRWVRLNPDCQPIRGWLVIEHLDEGYCRFVAHSVVRDAVGRLFDLTPPGMAARYPFIQHPHTGEEFTLMLARRGLVHIDHHLRDRPRP
jgi:hypothetical protein